MGFNPFDLVRRGTSKINGAFDLSPLRKFADRRIATSEALAKEVGLERNLRTVRKNGKNIQSRTSYTKTWDKQNPVYSVVDGKPITPDPIKYSRKDGFGGHISDTDRLKSLYYNKDGSWNKTAWSGTIAGLGVMGYGMDKMLSD